MAVVNNKISSAIVLYYSVGVNDDGSPITKGQRFSKVKINANDEDVHAVAKAIGEVLKNSITSIGIESKGILKG